MAAALGVGCWRPPLGGGQGGSVVVAPRAFAGGDIGDWVNREVRRLAPTGGVVRLPPGRFTFRRTIYLRPNVYLSGYGTELHYLGRGDAVRVPTYSHVPYMAGGVFGLRLFGPGNVAANGIHQMGAVGVSYRDVAVWGFKEGAGIWLDNRSGGYNERTLMEGVSVGDCAYAVRLSNSGGTDSFGYNNLVLLHVQLGPGEVGLELEGPRVRLYGSAINIDVNEFVRGGEPPATAILVERGARIEDCWLTAFGENSTGAGGGRGVVLASGGALVASGFIHWENLLDLFAPGTIYHLAGTPSDGANGAVRGW